MFEGMNWLGVGLGAILSFVAGWFYHSPKGFYLVWSPSAGVRHKAGDPMPAALWPG